MNLQDSGMIGKLTKTVYAHASTNAHTINILSTVLYFEDGNIQGYRTATAHRKNILITFLIWCDICVCVVTVRSTITYLCHLRDNEATGRLVRLAHPCDRSP